MQNHEPPLQLVMKRGGWEIGDENVTTLKDKSGEDAAVRTSQRQRSITGSTLFGSGRVYSAEEGKSCAIM